MSRRRVALVVLLAVVLAASSVAAGNEPPLADAGLDQWVDEGSSVRLDATGSRDPDGAIRSYRWTIEAPSGRPVAPACASCARTRFRATGIGRYEATVRVTDDDGATRSDTLYVYVERAAGNGTTTGTATPTVTATATSTSSPDRATPSPAPTPTDRPTRDSPSGTPTSPPTGTATPTGTTTPAGTATPTSTPTATEAPGSTPTPHTTPHPTPTPTPSDLPPVSLPDLCALLGGCETSPPEPTEPTEPPVALIDEEQIPDAGGGTALFEDGGSYDPDGHIVDREWTVGGERASNGSTLRTYLGSGEHTVTLTVIDDDGLEDTATTTVDVATIDDGCSSGCADLNVIGIDKTGSDAYVAAPNEMVTVRASVAWAGTTSERFNTVKSKFQGHSPVTSSGAHGSDDGTYQQKAGTTVDYTARVGWVSDLTTAWRDDPYTSTVKVVADRPTIIDDPLKSKDANIGPDEHSTDVSLSVAASDDDPGLVEYDWSVSGGADIYESADSDTATLSVDSEGEYTVTVTAEGTTPDGQRGVLASSVTSSATVSVDRIGATRGGGDHSDDDHGDDSSDNSAQTNGQAGDTDEGSGSGNGLLSGWF